MYLRMVSMTPEVKTINPEKLEKVAFILKTIAHPLRIAIVDLLSKRDRMMVNEITEALGSEQSLTSHHLTNMKLKGILASEREGKKVFYHLKMREVTGVLSCMDKCQAVL